MASRAGAAALGSAARCAEAQKKTWGQAHAGTHAIAIRHNHHQRPPRPQPCSPPSHRLHETLSLPPERSLPTESHLTNRRKLPTGRTPPQPPPQRKRVIHTMLQMRARSSTSLRPTDHTRAVHDPFRRQSPLKQVFAARDCRRLTGPITPTQSSVESNSSSA